MYSAYCGQLVIVLTWARSRIFVENEQIGPGYDLRRGENITHEGIQPFISYSGLKKKKNVPNDPD